MDETEAYGHDAEVFGTQPHPPKVDKGNRRTEHAQVIRKRPSGFLPCGQVIGVKLYWYVLYRFTLLYV